MSFFNKKKGYLEIGIDGKIKIYTDRQQKIRNRQAYLRFLAANNIEREYYD